ATSSMARALTRELAGQGASLLLCGRNANELKALTKDAELRGAPQSEALAFDARDATTFAAIVTRAAKSEGTINVAVFCGSMPPQAAVEADPSKLPGVIQDSYTGPAEILLMLAPLMEERGQGTIIGVGSVAGDRGRLSNYVYGSAKAGFHTFLAGLRNRMARKGVHVMTVKPGFVDTGMTWGVPGMFLVAQPEQVAEALLKGARKKKNVLYVPFFWWGIMTIIKSVPEFIFKKLKI
ncbi:MAG: SDR family NAD(P)-dependent oxidoreductase, partial [Deltaproteobacteria bacterium]